MAAMRPKRCSATLLRAAPHLRDQIEIVTKCDILVGAGRYASTRIKHYDTSAAHIAASVDHSLRLMGVDTLIFYWFIVQTH